VTVHVVAECLVHDICFTVTEVGEVKRAECRQFVSDVKQHSKQNRRRAAINICLFNDTCKSDY
jgi:hypothetical protein